MTLVCAVSDLHGYLPNIPDCDICVIGGDIVAMGAANTPEEEVAMYVRFGHWLTGLVRRGIIPIGIAGNHDFVLEEHENFARSLPWIYLCDEGVEVKGLTFWGVPWTPWYGGWAFNAPEVDPGEEFLRDKFDAVPDDCDVIISHGPPAGIRDRIGRKNVGSSALNRRIQQIMPRLVVFGHIHHEYGVEQIEGVTCANVSLCAVENNRYVPRHEPILFDL